MPCDRAELSGEAGDEVLKAIWTTDRIEFDRISYTIPKCHSAEANPRTAPPSTWPDSTPRAMARVARHGDGWLPLGLPIDDMAQRFAAIRSKAHDATGS